MRKMKKINGYLVVRFNDREKRERPELGNFGVIDAELYSGNLLVDLDAMEYTDADRIEVAMEQARGLDSEFDMEEPEVQVTVVKDVDGVTSEDSYNPVKMFGITRTLLEGDIQRGMGEDIDPRTAAHELRGFVQALMTMGVVRGDDERFYVALDSFEGARPRDKPRCDFRDDGYQSVQLLTGDGLAEMSPHDFVEQEVIEGCTVQVLRCRKCGYESFAWSRGKPPEREERLAYICDELCKYREGRTQEELDAICEKCEADKWAGGPPGQIRRLTCTAPKDIQALRRLLREIGDYTSDIRTQPPKEDFKHLPPVPDRWPDPSAVYRLGLVLEQECPKDGCQTYLHTFRMARDVDDALDTAEGRVAEVLERELRDHFRDLREMVNRDEDVGRFWNELPGKPEAAEETGCRVSPYKPWSKAAERKDLAHDRT